MKLTKGLLLIAIPLLLFVVGCGAVTPAPHRIFDTPSLSVRPLALLPAIFNLLFLVVAIGGGVGPGIAINDDVYRGAFGGTGEFGIRR